MYMSVPVKTVLKRKNENDGFVFLLPQYFSTLDPTHLLESHTFVKALITTFSIFAS